jgi:hypothetical protein
MDNNKCEICQTYEKMKGKNKCISCFGILNHNAKNGQLFTPENIILLANPKNTNVTKKQIINLQQFANRSQLNYLPKPKTNKAEVLWELLSTGEASILQFGYLCGFRTRISELVNKHYLKLNSEPISTKNKHGNTCTYINHILPITERKFAFELYKKINP